MKYFTMPTRKKKLQCLALGFNLFCNSNLHHHTLVYPLNWFGPWKIGLSHLTICLGIWFWILLQIQALLMTSCLLLAWLDLLISFLFALQYIIKHHKELCSLPRLLTYLPSSGHSLDPWEALSEVRMFLLVLLSTMLQWKIPIAFWLFVLSKDQSEKKSSRALHPTSSHTLRMSALFCETWGGSTLWVILVYRSSVVTLYCLYGANLRSLFDRVSFLPQKFVSTTFEKFSEYRLH